MTVYQHVKLYLFGFQHILASGQVFQLISQILFMLVTFIAVQIKNYRVTIDSRESLRILY